MIESWRPIPGYESIYEASDFGRVRGVDRIDASGRFRPGQLMTQVPHVTDGRFIVCLTRDGQHRTRYVHQLILEAFVGPRPSGMQGCHNNGKNTDNRLANLRWDTQSGNQLDAVRHGTHALASRTHCKRKHILEPPNLCNYGKTAGVRACLACNKARRHLQHHGGDMQTVSDEIYERIMSGEFRQRGAA